MFHEGVAGPARSATGHRPTDHTAQTEVTHQPPPSKTLVITGSHVGPEDHQQGLPLPIRTGSGSARATTGKQLAGWTRGHIIEGRLKERKRSEHKHSPFPPATAHSARGRSADPRGEQDSGPGVAGVQADLSLMKLASTDQPLDKNAMNSFRRGLGHARQNLVNTWLLNGLLAHTPRSRRSIPLYPPVLIQHFQPHHPRLFLEKRLRAPTAPRVSTVTALPDPRQPDQAPSPTLGGRHRRPSHLKRLEIISSSLGDSTHKRWLNTPTSKGSPVEVSSMERLKKCMQMTVVPSCGSSCPSADQLLEGIILCFLSQTDLQATGKLDGLGFAEGDGALNVDYGPLGIGATAPADPDPDNPLWRADDQLQ